VSSRIIPWGGSLLLHVSLLAGLMMIDTRLHAPVRVELFEFELLPARPTAETQATETSDLRQKPTPQAAPVPLEKAKDQAVADPPRKPAPRNQKAPPEPLPIKKPAPSPQPAPIEKVVQQAPTGVRQPLRPRDFPTVVAPQPTVKTGSGTIQNAEVSVKTAATGSASLRERYLTAHFSYIRDKVFSRLKYPNLARRMGWTGQVRVGFIILENGEIEQLRIEQSSGHKVLDRQALLAVEKAAPFPPPPVAADIILPVTFQLE
jgi:periplasmic protein TonB